MAEFAIAPEEQMFLYTDGLLENGDAKERIKFRHLKRLLRIEQSPKENIDSLNPAITKWGDHFDDDVTMIFYRHSG